MHVKISFVLHISVDISTTNDDRISRFNFVNTLAMASVFPSTSEICLHRTMLLHQLHIFHQMHAYVFYIAVLLGGIGLVVYGVSETGRTIFVGFYITVVGVAGLAIAALLVTIRALMPSHSANMIA